MPASNKKMAYDAKYQRENYDTILVRVPKGVREELRAKADQDGKSLNNYIVSKITEEG